MLLIGFVVERESSEPQGIRPIGLTRREPFREEPDHPLRGMHPRSEYAMNRRQMQVTPEFVERGSDRRIEHEAIDPPPEGTLGPTRPTGDIPPRRQSRLLVV